MNQFSICIAGVSIQVTAEYEDTKMFCRDFLTQAPPQIHIIITQEDLERARQTHIETDRSEGREPREYLQTEMENTALHLRVTEALVNFGMVLFHGCAVACQGKAYLFCADSGTGKTTHANLWCKCFPDSYILNGDKPFLLISEGSIYVCGTPWRGKERYGTNEVLPLGGICLLERSANNHIRSIRFKDGLDELLHHSYCPNNTISALQYMNFLKNLEKTPLYRLNCNMEDEAAFLSHATMTQQHKASSTPIVENIT